MATKKAAPSWSDVKVRLTDFDRAGLLGLLQDLYAAKEITKPFCTPALVWAMTCSSRTKPASTAGSGPM